MKLLVYMELQLFENIANEHYFRLNEINILNDTNPEDFTFYALEEFIDTDDKKNVLTEYVKTHNDNIKIGDTLVFCDPEQKYRNACTCLWNGTSIEMLDYEVDDYGGLPKIFQVSPGKFGPRYWKNVISHNDYYWVCKDYRQEAFNNVKIIQKLENNKIKTYFITHYTHNGIMEHLVLNEDYVDNNYTIKKFKKLLLNENIPWGFDGSDYHHLFESKNVSIIDFKYENNESIIDIKTENYDDINVS